MLWCQKIRIMIGKFGYVEVNLLKNDKYLVEIMYNYAKIEVIVDKSNLNECYVIYYKSY